MIIKTYPLGQPCSDVVTGIEGRLTHWAVNMSCNVQYVFQPKGLDQEGKLMEKILLCAARVKGLELEEEEIPFEILGSKIQDDHSGFKGVATFFKKHVNGCFHVHIQPQGLKNGKLQDEEDFDIRNCSGPMIKKLSEKEKKESEKTNPSPASTPKFKFG